MISFTSNYSKCLGDENFVDSIRNETLISIIINKYICKEKLWLGGNTDNHLPDLFNEDKSTGFEIVQCELDSDLNTKLIYKAIREKGIRNEDVADALRTFNSPSFDKSNYSFSIDNNGLIAGFTQNSLGRSPGYLQAILERNIKLKIEKMLKGNYSACKNLYLVLSNIERAKDKSDAELTKGIYHKLIKDKTQKFKDVFLVTTSGIYSLDDTIADVYFSSRTFNNCVKAMKRKLNLKKEL